MLKIVRRTKFKFMHYARLKTSTLTKKVTLYAYDNLHIWYENMMCILVLYFYKFIHQKHIQVNRFTSCCLVIIIITIVIENSTETFVRILFFYFIFFIVVAESNSTVYILNCSNFDLVFKFNIKYFIQRSNI